MFRKSKNSIISFSRLLFFVFAFPIWSFGQCTSETARAFSAVDLNADRLLDELDELSLRRASYLLQTTPTNLSGLDRRFDLDRNGRLTSEEVSRMRSLFNALKFRTDGEYEGCSFFSLTAYSILDITKIGARLDEPFSRSLINLVYGIFVADRGQRDNNDYVISRQAQRWSHLDLNRDGLINVTDLRIFDYALRSLNR